MKSVTAILVCLLFPAIRAGAEIPALSPTPLKADGTVLRDGQGKAVRLRGVNLGGWLKLESWMGPVDTSKTLRDGNPGHNGYDFEVRRLLTKRFGAKVAQELVDAYEDCWITAGDLDNIQSLGLNCVRLPLAWSTMVDEDGTWRKDGFARIDWLVAEAWKRGIYTVIDLHAFLPPGADHDGSATGYFANEAQQAETVRLWAHIAEHYRGKPAVAMYDLLNEPNNSAPKGRSAPKAAVVCRLYDRTYHAIREVDPDHVIAMEGLWGWDTLRDPRKYGYWNVVYSFHWYHWDAKNTAERNRGTDGDVKSALQMQKAWNIPVFIGEFNLFGDREAWRHALAEYDRNGLSWTIWSYKTTAGGSNSWGVYTTIPGKAPATPNLATDSADEIRRKWRAWRTTPETFNLNPMFFWLRKSFSK